MGAFTSKSKKPAAVQVTAVDRTVLDLKNSRDRLQRYRKKLEADEVKLLAQATKAKAAGRTETAMGILRLRKFKRQQAATCEDQLLNVLSMVETIDSKQNDAAMLDAMRAGKDTLKEMHEQTTVDDVLDLMDNIQETHAVEQEITDILQGVPQLSVEAEADVEAELAALQAEMNGGPVVVNQGTESLPTVPTHTPEVKVPVTAAASPAKAKPARVALPG